MGVEGAAIASVSHKSFFQRTVSSVYQRENAFVTVTQKKISNLKRREFAVHLNAALPVAFQSSDHRCWCYRCYKQH